jgi:hypothetical protein
MNTSWQEGTMKISKFSYIFLAFLFLGLTGLTLSAGNVLINEKTNIDLERTKLMLIRHQMQMRDLSPAELSTPTKISDVGNIVVMKGNRKTFFPRNPFDLTGRKISFIPNGTGGYDVKVSSGSISTTQGRSIPVSSNSKRINFTSGFSFPYYGVTYTSLLVNGCGNVSFGAKGVSCNSVIGYLVGPPIIVPFEGSFPDEVQILQTPTKFAVSWTTSSPDSPARPNSQVNLLKNGTIELLYEGDYKDGGRTGISPGNITTSDLKLVNFSSGSTLHGGPKTAFFEEFRPEPQVDLIAVLQEFHRTHSHNFDFVTVFTDYSYPYESRYFSPTQNSIRGIGLSKFGIGQEEYFGSSQIQGLIMMNSLNDFPPDPTAPLEDTFNTLRLMGNLHGRRWMPYVQVKIGGVKKNDLLGYFDFFGIETYSSGRWNFFMDTDASVMGGNEITDNGNGTFTTTAATLRYSKLDQYLMGLIPSSAVPPFFYAGTSPTDFFSESPGSGSPPQVNVTFGGTRVNVTINQIIEAEGPRVPSIKTSQKQFREAFIYFIRPGSHANPAQLAKIDNIRTRWQTFFSAATDHHGTMITRLK